MPYGISDEEEENDDDTISIPDTSTLRGQIHRRSNDIVLQNIQMHTIKAACVMTDACDKIMDLNLKSDQCTEMIIPVIDVLALLEVVTAEINQFRREQMKN